MKKLLAILGAVGLTAAGSSTVIACNDKTDDGSGGNEPVEKVSLSTVNSITPPTSVTANTPATTTVAEVKAALDPQVQEAVAKVSQNATASNDYDYKIYSDQGGTTELTGTIDLDAGAVDVYVQITAKGSSTLLSGQSTVLKVTLPKHS